MNFLDISEYHCWEIFEFLETLNSQKNIVKSCFDTIFNNLKLLQ